MKPLALFLLLLPLLLRAGDDRLGVQTHYGHRGWEPLSTLDAIRELGVGWIRDDLFWSSVEREPGKYEIPAYVREWLEAAKARKLKVILVLNGDNGKCYPDPFDPEGYANFARFAAKELKGYVHAFELINEPFNHFRKAAAKTLKQPAAWNGWDPKTQALQPWVHKYLDTMNRAAGAIHEAVPGEYRIIGLGCSPALNKMMLRQGVSKHVNGIAMHPYPYHLPPEWLPAGDTEFYRNRDGVGVGDASGSLLSINADLLTTAKKHGGPAELWLTEQGYTTFQPVDDRSSYAGFTEEAQAKYAQRRLMECLGSGVRFAAWYNFYSKGDRPHNSEDNFGLMRRDGSLKPAYHAIQRLARSMRHRQPAAWGTFELRFAPDRPKNLPASSDRPLAPPKSCRLYPFTDERNGERSLALWSTERAGSDYQPRTADLAVTTDRIPAKITIFDLSSGECRPVEFTVESGTVTLKNLMVPDYPILLILDKESGK